VLGNAQKDTTTANIENGVLFPYTKSTAIYRCPGDKAVVRSSGRTFPRTRAYSINGWMNSELEGKGWSWGGENSSEYAFTKYSQLTSNPTVEKAVVFIDEHERSIDDGIFIINNLTVLPPIYAWAELPTDRHNRGCNLSFADGHVDHWKWKWPKRFIRYRQSCANALDRQDYDRLQTGIPKLPPEDSIPPNAK
jgi:prepilin-type processing-associated H-X9-DG protein